MDLNKAKALLQQNIYTCVLCKGNQIYTSTQRGVAPLMGYWQDGTDLKDFSAADKVVGKATALLYALLGVKAVYAAVMSRPALRVLETHSICASYGQLVDAIINRTGDGFCPMETATKDIDDPAAAPAAIVAALKSIRHDTSFSDHHS